MESWAANPAHGYDQTYRWGQKGDFDCSAAVIQAWENAGVPVKTKGATYTGNMLNVFLNCGFKNVTSSVNLSTGSGMKRGDVLLNVTTHTAMYCGDGYEVEASINERGTITGGQPGDQTGSEFLKRKYRNFPWNYVLRYTEDGETTTKNTVTNGETYHTVDYGDNLWNLAVKYLGDGTRYGEIIEANGLTSDFLSVGQVLKIPGTATPEATESTQTTTSLLCTATLPLLKMGDVGLSVRSLQTLLKMTSQKALKTTSTLRWLKTLQNLKTLRLCLFPQESKKKFHSLTLKKRQCFWKNLEWQSPVLTD